MQTRLRVMLLAACAALGVAAALALAVATPHSKSLEETAAPASLKLAARVTLEQPPPQTMPAPEHSQPVPEPIPEPVVAPYRDRVARQVGQIEESLQELEESSHRRERSMLRAIAAIQERIEDTPRQPLPTVTQPAEVEAAPPALEVPAGEPPAAPTPEAKADVRRAEGDENLTINIQNTDIRAVLEMISRETGLNIIASRKVTGSVTANLNNVDLETALAAILKSTGFAAAREGNILYIGEPGDLQLMNQSQDRVNTRIYRPNYVKAAD
jgi:type IV pilus assembly protein PilQ